MRFLDAYGPPVAGLATASALLLCQPARLVCLRLPILGTRKNSRLYWSACRFFVDR
jgi:hypothetical protein